MKYDPRFKISKDKLGKFKTNNRNDAENIDPIKKESFVNTINKEEKLSKEEIIKMIFDDSEADYKIDNELENESTHEDVFHEHKYHDSKYKMDANISEIYQSQLSELDILPPSISISNHINHPIIDTTSIPIKPSMTTSKVSKKKKNLNENFVKLDIKHKKFCKFRKKNSSYYCKMKRSAYYKNKKQQDGSAMNTIHSILENDVSVNSCDEQDNEITLEAFKNEIKDLKIDRNAFSSLNNNNDKNDELLETHVPTFNETNIEKDIETVANEFKIKLKPEQVITIRRILNMKSTLLIAPTNFGKSICYQIPALLYYRYYKSLTIVISPLISLIHDQICCLPSFIQGACIHSGLSKEEREDILYGLSRRKYALLFMAPEALAFYSSYILKNLPPISFVCVDEVHCLSSWSYNFRPSYLRVCSFLRNQHFVHCFLGLSATVKQKDIKDLMENLFIPTELQSEAVIGKVLLPSNIKTNAAIYSDKLNGLYGLLDEQLECVCGGVLIFCRRRITVESVASFLRTKFNGKKGVISTTSIECFHAGMSVTQRGQIQKNFIQDRIKILVATSAIGMGLNKSNIRLIVHYDIPGSLEQYIQEIGRAGRDGLLCQSHILLTDQLNLELNEIKRNIHQDRVDRNMVKRLVNNIFAINPQPLDTHASSDAAIDGGDEAEDHIVGLDKSSIVLDLDLKLETVETLLYLIEKTITPQSFPTLRFKYISSTEYSSCKITWYSSLRKIKDQLILCKSFLYGLKNTKELNSHLNHIDVNILEASNYFKTFPKSIINDIWILKSSICRNILLDFQVDKIILKTSHSTTLEIQQELIDHLSLVLDEIYQGHMKNINFMFSLFQSAGSGQPGRKDEFMKECILSYFNDSNYETSSILTNQVSNDEINSFSSSFSDIHEDIKTLLEVYPEYLFSPHSIARIFHGIESPKFPISVFGKDIRFWRKHLQISFDHIKNYATSIVIDYYTK